MDVNEALSCLGLNSNYSVEELKLNYKKLARKFHPDNQASGDVLKFKKVRSSYEFLSTLGQKQSAILLKHESIFNVVVRR